VDSALQHCPDSASTDHSAEPDGTSPRIVAGALGFDPLVGEEHVRHSHDDVRSETAATSGGQRETTVLF
jgi:hypothetical protein